MNFSLNKKTIIVATVALAACLAVAVIVFVGLRMIVPKNTATKPETPTSSETVPQTKDQLAKEADRLFQAGDDALKIGNAEKGIAELKKAQLLYDQIGDITKIEQIKDQIALAEHAIALQKEYVSADKLTDRGKTSNAP